MNPKISKRVFWAIFIVTVIVAFCYYVFGYKVSGSGDTVPVCLPLLVILLSIVVGGGLILFVISFVKDMVQDIRRNKLIAFMQIGIFLAVLLIIALFYFISKERSVGLRIADTSIKSIILFVCVGLLGMLYFKLNKKIKR